MVLQNSGIRIFPTVSSTYSISELIAEAKNKNIRTSLAVFKPTEVLDFVYEEEEEREWAPEKLA